MEEEKRATYIEDEEIDLWEYFLVLKKRLKLIFGIFVIAVLLTGIISYLMTPVYRSSFIIKVPTITPSPTKEMPIISTTETERLIKSLNDLRNEESFKDLSEKLLIKEEKARQIASLKAKTLRNEKHSVEISLDVHNPVLIKEISDGIMKFLNQNQYVIDKISSERDRLINLKEEFEPRIKEMERVKNAIIEQIRKQGMKNLSFNPVEMERELINLKQRLMDIEKNSKLIKGFEILSEPVIPKKPVKPKKALNIAIAGITSLFFGIFLAFFITWIEKNRKRRALSP